MTIDALAKFILSTSPNITNKKLQKLCYYVYAWYLAVNHERIAEVVFEAWAHGPVSPQIYSQYRRFGWEEIPQFRGFLPVKEEQAVFINNILSYYGCFSADELEKMTHDEQPWMNARKGYKPYQSSNEVISDYDMVEYYSKQRELYRRFAG